MLSNHKEAIPERDTPDSNTELQIQGKSITKEELSIKHLNLIEEVSLTGGKRKLITLEMWSYEAKMLMDAIHTHQVEILCEPQTPEGQYEYRTLEAIRTSLEGQVGILYRIKGAKGIA